MTTPLHFQSASELVPQLVRGTLKSRDLLEHLLARIEQHNPTLNAVIWMDGEGARAQADAADVAAARGQIWGPLHGIPMTIKESYRVAGSPTTWGNPNFRNNVTEDDALTVERLKKAGAIVFGKSNVPFMLADWQSFNAIYGTTNNPRPLHNSPV
jgi:amidase